MNRKKLAILFLALMLPLTAAAQVSFKRDKGDRLNFEISPGTSYTHSINVVNLKEEPIDVELYATDGTQTNTGGFTVRSQSDEQANIGLWTTFEETLLHLEGKSERAVKFTITVPVDVTPGVYGGGLSISPVNTARGGGATGAIVSTRVVAPVFVTVPGEKITRFNWSDFSHSFNKKHLFKFSFENTGNTVIQIKGKLTLQDLLGNVTEIPMNDMTLLRGDKVSPEISWNERPWWGFYTAKAELTFHELNMQLNAFEEFDAQTKELTFNVIPWPIILGILILIALIIVLEVWRRASFKKLLKKCVKYQVKEGDSLNSIASAHGIGWKKLAKINNIEPPYDLKKGGSLLVPPKK